MENKTLVKIADDTKNTVESVINDLIIEIESIETERDKLQGQVNTLESALATATEMISKLQKQINGNSNF